MFRWDYRDDGSLLKNYSTLDTLFFLFFLLLLLFGFDLKRVPGLVLNDSPLQPFPSHAAGATCWPGTGGDNWDFRGGFASSEKTPQRLQDSQ